MSIIKIPDLKPSKATIDYLEILFNDTGFTLATRNSWLSSMTGKRIKYLDELTQVEASKSISALKEIKELLSNKKDA